MGKFVSLKDDVSFKYLFLNETVRLYFISDVLGITPEEIRSVRLANTFLWKRFFKQKQGILDVLIELNNASRINIELQLRAFAYWDKRSIFYLTKLFAEDLLAGERYERLKRCVSISILGFNLDERPEYHKIYRLRDEFGYEFTDLLEIHVVELNKSLNGSSRMDDWIRLFNTQTEEELNMLQASTKNLGIMEAIKEARTMRLGKTLRVLYDAHMKQIRDRNARDDYVRMEGRSEGEDRMNRLVLSLIQAGRQEDIERAATDKKYRDQLYEEFGIE